MALFWRTVELSWDPPTIIRRLTYYNNSNIDIRVEKQYIEYLLDVFSLTVLEFKLSKYLTHIIQEINTEVQQIAEFRSYRIYVQ